MLSPKEIFAIHAEQDELKLQNHFSFLQKPDQPKRKIEQVGEEKAQEAGLQQPVAREKKLKK